MIISLFKQQKLILLLLMSLFSTIVDARSFQDELEGTVFAGGYAGNGETDDGAGAYFIDSAGQPVYDLGSNEDWRDKNYSLVNPIANVHVSMDGRSSARTAADGSYNMSYIRHCGFSPYSGAVVVTLYTRGFNPRGTGTTPYTFTRFNNDLCYFTFSTYWQTNSLAHNPFGLWTYPTLHGVSSYYEKPLEPLDIPIDITVLGGKIIIPNVTLGDETKYDTSRASGENAAYDTEDRALLETISEEDLQNTDIYIIRVSDGSLISERRGSKSEEIKAESSTAEIGYSLNFINKRASSKPVQGEAFRVNRGSFRSYVRIGNMRADEYAKEVDYIRVGESVKIVAINRATGYLGSAITRVQEATALSLDFVIPEINLAPPNLKVWAYRNWEIEQGGSNEQKENIIGSEGAGLTSDKSIIVSTEWLDENDVALPSVLDEYGLSGRLAYTKIGKELSPYQGADSSNSAISHFTIKPGKQLQLIKLSNQDFGAEHFYIHVSGEPSSRGADMGVSDEDKFKPNTEGSAQILRYRPEKFAPFKVNIFDAQTYESDEPNFKGMNTYYKWVYRPEYQFSIYDLEIDEFKIDDNKENPVIQTLDDGTVIDSTLEVLYDLTGSVNTALDSYSFYGIRKFTFSLGDDWLHATIEKDGEILWDDLDGVSKLDSEDWLTARLFSNNDIANVLAEFYAVQVTATKIYQADNSCNHAPNPKHHLESPTYHYHNILPIVYQVSNPTRAEFIISGIVFSGLSFSEVGIKMKLANSDGSAGTWVDTDFKWVNNTTLRVNFDLSSQPQVKDPFRIRSGDIYYSGDPIYEIYFYVDSNSSFDLETNKEIPLRLNAISSNNNKLNLRVMALNQTNYNLHKTFARNTIDWIVDSPEIGMQLFDLFLNTTLSELTDYPLNVNKTIKAFTYGNHSNAATQTNSATRKQQLLQNGWGYASGVSWTDQPQCTSDIFEFKHLPESKLSKLVHADHGSKIKSAVKPLIDNQKLKEAIRQAKANKNANLCTVASYNTIFDENLAESFCFTFTNDTSYLSVNFTTDPTDPPLNIDESNNVTAALGGAHMNVDDNIAIRVFEGRFFEDDHVEVVVTGEVYDFYDFSIGNLNAGRDFNTSGGWVQMGYNKLSRSFGKVFSTSVPINFKQKYDINYD